MRPQKPDSDQSSSASRIGRRQRQWCFVRKHDATTVGEIHAKEFSSFAPGGGIDRDHGAKGLRERQCFSGGTLRPAKDFRQVCDSAS